MPSSRTVHAPQWPSAHAIFVPVRPRSSRSVSARVRPTGASSSYCSPLILSSSTAGHRNNVCEVDEPEGDAPCVHLVLLFDLRKLAPGLLSDREQLPNALEVALAVALGGGIGREPDDADRVGLPRPQERRR